MSSIRLIGSSLGAIGKSGLLGPLSPAQSWRVATALARRGINAGSAYALGAAIRPDATAVLDDDGGWTFAEMEASAAAVAAGLSALGVGPSSTVGLLCRNHRGLLLAMVALGQLGADTVYLNTGFAGPQLRAVLESEGVDTVVADEEWVPLLRGPRPLVTVVAHTDRQATDGASPSGPSRRPEHPTLQSMVDAGGAPVGRPSRTGRQVLLTSGTTGAPKGANRRTPSGTADTLGGGVGVLARIPYRRGDTTVMAAPMFHAWGLANTAVALAFASTLVVSRHFDPERTLDTIERTRASVLVAVPVMLQRILQLPDETLAARDLSSLRVVAVSGSALPGELARHWMDAFGDNLYSLYGSTEVGWVSVAGPDELRVAPGTAGRLLPGVDVRFVDGLGHPVAAGEPGRIMVRSGLTFDGYTGGATKEVVDGAMSSGDVGHLDGDLLFVDGRDDEMIVSGGENVFPREVEDVLTEHPGVAEAGVAGVADDEWGQRLEAWVVLRPGASVGIDELTAVVRDRLARYKVPRRIHLVDALPRTTTGKVIRRELRGSQEREAHREREAHPERKGRQEPRGV